MAMGDDSVECGSQHEGAVAEAVEFYGSLGFKVVAKEAREQFSFCSFTHLSRGIAVPERWQRTYYRALSKPKLPLAEYVQFMEEIRHLPGETRSAVSAVLRERVSEFAAGGAANGA